MPLASVVTRIIHQPSNSKPVEQCVIDSVKNLEQLSLKDVCPTSLVV